MQNFEIERKFLVKKRPPNLDTYPHKEILQGYLAIAESGTEVRLRQKGCRFYQTVKIGAGLKRQEVEVAVTFEQFERLWPLTAGKRVEKVRYEIAHGSFTIELDVYRGALAGLLVAEVEFVSEAESQAFSPPKWFGEEVTEDKRYKNKNLAVHGMPG